MDAVLLLTCEFEVPIPSQDRQNQFAILLLRKFLKHQVRKGLAQAKAKVQEEKKRSEFIIEFWK